MPVAIAFQIDPVTRQRVANLTPEQVGRAVKAAGRDFQIIMLRELPRVTGRVITKREGTLARRWEARQDSDGNLLFANTARSKKAPHTPYATFLEFGTRAHWVRPVTKRQLSWRSGGKPPHSAFVVSKKTKTDEYLHSKGHRVKGIRPRQMFLIAWRENQNKLAHFLSLAAKRLLGGT